MLQGKLNFIYSFRELRPVQHKAYQTETLKLEPQDLGGISALVELLIIKCNYT